MSVFGSLKLLKMTNLLVIHHNLCKTVTFKWTLYDAFGPGAKCLHTGKLR